jgi:O-antigen/teichoic acid export membrane protein
MSKFIDLEFFKKDWVSRLKNEIVTAYQLYLGTRMLLGVITSILMVKSGLSREDVGKYEILFFMIQVTTMFWSSGIAGAMTSLFVKMNRDISTMRTAWKLMQIIACIACISFMVYGFIEDQFTFVLGGIFVLLSGVLPLIESRFLVLNDPKGLHRYNLWSHLLLLILFFFGFVFKVGILYYIIFQILYSLIRWMYLYYLLDPLHASATNLYSLIRYVYPIVLTSFIGVLMDTLDGLLVIHYFDDAQFAIFRYGGRELPMTTVIFSGLSLAFIPLLAAKSVDLTNLKKKVDSWVKLLFPLALLLMILSPTIFRWLYSDQYIFSAAIFNTYLLILISRVLMPQTILQAYHHNGVILRTSIIELLINIILSMVWVQYFGMIGLALATFMAYLAQKIIMVIELYRLEGIIISEYIDMKLYLFYTSLLLMTYIFTIYPYL